MRALSLLQCIKNKAQAVWPGLSIEQLSEKLVQTQRFMLPSPSNKGPNRAALVFLKAAPGPEKAGQGAGPGHVAAGLKKPRYAPGQSSLGFITCRSVAQIRNKLPLQGLIFALSRAEKYTLFGTNFQLLFGGNEHVSRICTEQD
jgi:hypothetical protein